MAEGTEVAGSLPLRAPHHLGAGELLTQRDGEEGVRLVVAVLDVEPRVELLDPAVLELECLDLGRDDGPLDAGAGPDHRGGTRVQGLDVLEVRGQPRAQRLGLADVDDPAVLVAEPVHTRVDRDLPWPGAVRRRVSHRSHPPAGGPTLAGGGTSTGQPSGSPPGGGPHPGRGRYVDGSAIGVTPLRGAPPWPGAVPRRVSHRGHPPAGGPTLAGGGTSTGQPSESPPSGGPHPGRGRYVDGSAIGVTPRRGAPPWPGAVPRRVSHRSHPPAGVATLAGGGTSTGRPRFHSRRRVGLPFERPTGMRRRRACLPQTSTTRTCLRSIGRSPGSGRLLRHVPVVAAGRARPSRRLPVRRCRPSLR